MLHRILLSVAVRNCCLAVAGALLIIAAPLHAQVRTDEFITVSDGIMLDATVIKPSGAPPAGGFPGVVLIHGYGGSKKDLLPVANLLAAVGYASLSYSVRGQGASGGLSSTDGPRERQDLLEVIQHFRGTAGIDSGNLGVAGGSQGGIHSWMAAAYRMPGVKAIAPLIATPDFATALVPNGCVKIALPLEMTLGSVRYGPERDRARGFIIADQYDSLLSFINARDLAGMLDSVRVPVYQGLGWADYIFPANGGIRAAARLLSRDIPVWSYYGTNGHGETIDYPQASFQFGKSIQWFNHWLKGEPLSQDSLSLVYYADDRPGWQLHTTTVWPPQLSSTLRLYLTPGGLSLSNVSGAAASDPAFAFTQIYDQSYTPQMGWDDRYSGSRFMQAFTGSPVRLVSPPLGQDMDITGIPTGLLQVQSDAREFQAHVLLYDVVDTAWHLMSRSINGIRSNAAGDTHELHLESTALSHIIPAGHMVGLEVTSLDFLRAGQANVVPYFVTSHSSILSSASSPSYIDLPVVGPLPGVAAVSETHNSPAQFVLEQNYPNPFNPVTIIKYTVAGSRDQGSGISDVKITVYDVLGREVAVLVNERKAPGTYTVTFDGSRLPSGAYFYRLIAGQFTQTKRMMLVK